MSQGKFTTWMLAWHARFEKMEVGTAYEVAKCAKDVELFEGICKIFRDTHPRGHQYYFVDDYKFFKRHTDIEL